MENKEKCESISSTAVAQLSENKKTFNDPAEGLDQLGTGSFKRQALRDARLKLRGGVVHF